MLRNYALSKYAVWVAFNAFYSSRMYDEVGDWNQLHAYTDEPEIIDQHIRLLSKDKDYRKSVNQLKKKGVYNTSKGTHRKIADPYNLTQVASCLYQIRCNLFHGGKTPGDMRDEALVKEAHTITSRLVEGGLNLGES